MRSRKTLTRHFCHASRVRREKGDPLAGVGGWAARGPRVGRHATRVLSLHVLNHLIVVGVGVAFLPAIFIGALDL